jgi:hypothetical protein
MNNTDRLARCTRGLSIIAACALAWIPLHASANITNTIPYTNSFEAYTAGQTVVGSGGWYAAETSAAVVVADTYTYQGELPLPDPHTKILGVSEPVTNMITGGTGSVIYIDTMVSGLPWDEETPPAVTNLQTAIYVNTNGHPMVWHKHYSFLQPEQTNLWSELSDITISSGQWFRVTAEMKYDGQDFVAGLFRFFQLYVDGEAVTNKGARTAPSYPSNPGGTWFPMAEQGRDYLSSIEFSGKGYLDDLQVTTNNPNTATLYTIVASVDNGDAAWIVPAGNVRVAASNDAPFSIFAKPNYAITNVVVDDVLIGPTNAYTFYEVVTNHTIHVLSGSTEPQTTDNGVPYAWLDQYPELGGDDTTDYDQDGQLTWEEYVMGTDPTTNASVGRILDVGYLTGSNYVTWYATTNSGVNETFDMYRSTNAVDDEYVWDLVYTGIQRADDGTNTWWDTAAPTNGVPVLYWPSVLWTTD